MSYDPSISLNASEFVAAWNSTNQGMPERVGSGNEATYDFTFDLNNITADGPTLSADTISTNTGPALWAGDVRTSATDENSSFNQYSIELEPNTLAVNKAYQDQRSSMTDDMCFSVATTATLKMTIARRVNGDTRVPYVRVFGVLLEQ